MPRLTANDDLEQHNLPTGTYGYSAARIENLEATEYTLVDIIVDVSGSVAGYKDDLEACLRAIVEACRHSPRADNLLLRLVSFHTTLLEHHGYKLLMQCNPDDYLDSLSCGGMTALYDASENAVRAATDYGKKLTEQDFDVNAVVFVITDGGDNSSVMSAKAVGTALHDAVHSEAIESLVSVLVGVGVKDTPQLSQYLQKFQTDAGFTGYEEIDKADAKPLAKLAEFVAKSISAQSQALGSGGPSTLLSLNV